MADSELFESYYATSRGERDKHGGDLIRPVFIAPQNFSGERLVKVRELQPD